jgi:2-amino-4-hydroxy-6-hydroxymethyldihydropteridine diphosphokinase
MILISIGANLPSPSSGPVIDTCEQAAEAIRELPGLEFLALSPWYRTAAIPKSSQPDYCNGVIRMEGNVEPTSLLAALNEIEARSGRVRSIRNAARPLDLDIIDLNGIISALPPVILPHPRAHLRAFVLRPILDVAPGWRHPTLRRGIAALLSELSPQPIEPWFS